MSDWFSEKIVTARKDYTCDACEWLSNSDDDYRNAGFTFAEYRAIAKAEKQKCMIKKGEKYVFQRGVYDGAFYTSRSIPAIGEICSKYGYYDD